MVALYSRPVHPLNRTPPSHIFLFTCSQFPAQHLMASSLVSLPIELFQRVVELLSIEDTRDLLSTCSNLYSNSKNILKKKCFSVLPVNLSEESLQQAEDILTKEPYHYFLQAVHIRLD